MQAVLRLKWMLFSVGLGVLWAQAAWAWQADNGNGTFTNPLFYDEFSDPDLIRVGDDFYLTGTTMHSMPGLPVLQSRDLVNWRLLGYAFDQLDLGPACRLERGQSVYGQGIWAPSFRYHDGTFHIFSNVNGHGTQRFTATDPAGPWTRSQMKGTFHDLSVLFDDDGKVYVVWGYQGMQFAQLNEDLTDIVPGTQRTLFDKDAGMGEGAHFYKIDGRYYITSAWFAGRMRMPCARADRPEGPYEINPAISVDEDFGLAEGYRLGRGPTPPFNLVPPNTRPGGRMSLHQGGVVQTPAGEWWGFSMMDYNSVGRLTCLSPVTWQDGWPYFGLPGKSRADPPYLGQAPHRKARRAQRALRAERRLFRPRTGQRVAVEPRARFRPVVPVGAARVPALARPAFGGSLAGPQHPDATGHRSGVHPHGPTGRRRLAARGRGRPGPGELALRLDRGEVPGG